MNIVVYPKGFLGFDIGLIAKDNSGSLEQVVQAIKLNKPIAKTNIGISNHDVDKLWEQYCGGFQFTTSFEFREKILLAALRAFGTDNFYEWCKLQEQSPFYTDMHRRFLIDTLEFINTGHRSMNVQTWSRLIEAREVGVNDRNIRVNFDNYFNISAPNENGLTTIENKPGVDLNKVIWHWTKAPNGVEDLIASLQIFFGSSY